MGKQEDGGLDEIIHIWIAECVLASRINKGLQTRPRLAAIPFTYGVEAIDAAIIRPPLTLPEGSDDLSL